MFVYLLKLPKMCGECARASVCVCASLSATSKCVYLSNLKLLLRLLSRSNLSLLLLFASTLNAQHVHRNFWLLFLVYRIPCLYLYFPLAPNLHLQNDFTTSICNYEMRLIVGDDDSCLTTYLECAEMNTLFRETFRINRNFEIEMVSCAE